MIDVNQIKNLPTHRTVNGETITGDNGDINLHDGFYFPNAVQDYDGNWYSAVVIGKQVWLAKNLYTTHFMDGTPITDKTSASSPYDTSIPCYYHHTNNGFPAYSNINVGLLYNYEAANSSSSYKLLPSKWKLPSISDYRELYTYVANQERYKINGSVCSTKALAIDKLSPYNSPYWTTVQSIVGTNIDKNNSTGFNAVACGRLPEEIVGSAGFNCYFWTSNQNRAFIGYSSSTAGTDSDATTRTKSDYYAVRLMFDGTPTQFRNWYLAQYGSLQHHIMPNEVLMCTLTATTVGNNTTYSCDKTAAEIHTAAISGKVVLLKFDKLFLRLIAVGEGPRLYFSHSEIAYGNDGDHYTFDFCRVEYSDGEWVFENGNGYIPAPSASDEGKLLSVNSNGDYELVSIVNSELIAY